MAERVSSFRDSAHFAVSANDVLVYRTADTDSRLTSFDRQGTVSGRASEPGGFRGVTLSPDGARRSASRTIRWTRRRPTCGCSTCPGEAGRTTDARRRTRRVSVWSSDGKRHRLLVQQQHARQRLASGRRTRRSSCEPPCSPFFRTVGRLTDGSFCTTTYVATASNTGSSDLLVFPSQTRSCGIVRTRFNDEQGRFSPNRRWVAYVSNQSGLSEVYVRELERIPQRLKQPEAACRCLTAAARNHAGVEMAASSFTLAPNGKIMAVEMIPARISTPDAENSLFQAPPGAVVGDVTAARPSDFSS